ncbi:MAG TPA: hypothetical protein VFN44_23675 [Solirubrobacteraceae bacterium]|nr:hypothetical protein [Solirubrobacteraceae bacterium]
MPAPRQAPPVPAAYMRLLIALALVSAWSMVPPFLTEIDVARSVEVVDHVIPGLIALGASLVALAAARRGEPESARALVAIGVCTVASLWEVGTHLTLILDAGESGRPVGAVLLHASPGFVMLGLSGWLLLAPPGSR